MGLAYFMALGVVLPVVPQYVKHRLGGGSIAVGVAVGALFVGAVLLRPYAGRLGDRFGRRVLIVSGALVVAVSVSLYGAVPSLGFLIFARALTGLGEAAFFVGAASMVADLAPVQRRGEAFSYWSVAVYGGLAFGPALGETIRDSAGISTVWLVAGGLGVLAAVLGTFTREVERPEGAPTDSRIVNRAAVGPGIVLLAGLISLAAFTAFVPLYVDDIGLGSADVVFLLYGGLVLLVRVIGARIPDRLGGRTGGTAALVLSGAGHGRDGGLGDRRRSARGHRAARGGRVAALPGAAAARVGERARDRARRWSGPSRASSTSRRVPGRSAWARSRHSRATAARSRREPSSRSSGSRCFVDAQSRAAGASASQKLARSRPSIRARERVAARDQRLPAQSRWHPVVLATSCGAGFRPTTPRCSRPRTTGARVGCRAAFPHRACDRALVAADASDSSTCGRVGA